MNFSDEWIIEQFNEVFAAAEIIRKQHNRPDEGRSGNAAIYAVVEHMVDQEVAAGEYGGCTTDLELAWAGHESRVRQVLRAAGIEVK